ncbi:hypothetical protein [Tissierella praeacuta]|uniref:hypothetical protein n=1 Tax=Tissierella praeacuta TaxID=43131 RepID=UPI002FD9FECF
MRFDRLERSPLRLVRTIYFKIVDEDKTYFLIEKAFTSKYDGMIKVDKITEKEYKKAVLKKERTEEINIEDARLNIKNSIKELYADVK